MSVVGHLAVVLALLNAQPAPPAPPPEPPVMTVLLTQLPPPPVETPEPTPEPPAPVAKPKPKPKPTKPPPKRIAARRAPPSTEVAPLPAGETSAADGTGEASDAQVAGAATAGSGGMGGGCNMTRRLQAALRKDQRVQAAVAEAHRGRALMVWNGGWVRHGQQEGAGLAAVREAIMWEVGFAPEACRSQPVHGLVMISLNDTPGSARLVVGSGAWRWTDLLSARRTLAR